MAAGNILAGMLYIASVSEKRQLPNAMYFHTIGST